jgi:hypothetical protein
MGHATTYRFRDFAALSVPLGNIYLDASAARQLGTALLRVAKSIETTKSTDAPSLSVQVPGFTRAADLIDIAQIGEMAQAHAMEAERTARWAESDFWLALQVATAAAEVARFDQAHAWAQSTTSRSIAAFQTREPADRGHVLARLRALTDAGAAMGTETGRRLANVARDTATVFRAALGAHEAAITARRMSALATSSASKRNLKQTIQRENAGHRALAKAAQHRETCRDGLMAVQTVLEALRAYPEVA